RVFQFVQKGDYSVEVLLNFNVHSFCRRGLAALALEKRIPRESTVPEAEWEPDAPPNLARLDAIVGGEWWRQVLQDEEDYARAVELVTHAFCGQLSSRFREVCRHDVKEK